MTEIRAKLWVLAYKLFYSERVRVISESRLLMRVTEFLQNGLTYNEANDRWYGEPAERFPDLRQKGDADEEAGGDSRGPSAVAARRSGVDEPALLVDGPMVVSEVEGVLRFTRIPWTELDG